MNNNNQHIPLLLLLLALSNELVSASNRPGSGGGCDGSPPNLLPGQRPRPGFGGGGNLGQPGLTIPGMPTGGNGGNGAAGGNGSTNSGVGGGNTTDPAQRFLIDVANPAYKRSLQDGPLAMLSDEDLAICCSGNGDFDFLIRNLDLGGLAVATEADGFLEIPGDSRMGCRIACRGFFTDEAELQLCFEACDCRQDCPFSPDYLSQECKAECNTLVGDEAILLCYEECDIQCGERCRSTYNGYVVPLDIYSEGLKILDCYYGDLTGDQTGSCATGQSFWQQAGFTCDVTAGDNFECDCDEPGTCFNVVYPCNYDYFCTSSSPSLEPSASPSESRSRAPTGSPTPKPTRGKGKGSSKSGSRRNNSRKLEDDDRRAAQRARRVRRGLNSAGYR